MTGPLHITFDVACDRDHAFATWTEGIAAWWPRDHTVSGPGELHVVLERGIGGRIYERTAGGVEHDWGVITDWEPPARLAYTWHLGSDASSATDVSVSFTAVSPHVTRVDIDHRGWDRLGAAAATWRERNRSGWDSLVPHYAAAACADKLR